jgi:predicted RNA-binding Zn-ribbon protein involved in translation (DUF1610 family)
VNVRVTCPDCGDTAVSVATVLIVRHPAGVMFRFECPGCGQSVQKRAVGRVPEMLLAAGAREQGLPALSLDDLAGLQLDLDAEDWLDRLRLASPLT